VNAVTEAGTNSYSGTLSGYFRDDAFNAADPIVTRAAVLEPAGERDVWRTS